MFNFCCFKSSFFRLSSSLMGVDGGVLSPVDPESDDRAFPSVFSNFQNMSLNSNEKTSIIIIKITYESLQEVDCGVPTGLVMMIVIHY